jgi:hypothetical protein
MLGTAVSDKSITFMTLCVSVHEPVLLSATGIAFVSEADTSSLPRISGLL